MATRADRERFLKKIDQAVRELRSRRVAGRWSIAPPLWRGLWRLGVKIPPPHFMPFSHYCLVLALWFGFLVSVVALLWYDVSWHTFVAIVIAILVSGVLVRFKAWSCSLPRWEDYPFVDEDVFE